MPFLHRMRRSFRSKVAMTAWTTTILALLFGFTLFVVQQWGEERGRLVRERSTVANVLAQNLSASLVFGDRDAAQSRLGSLSHLESVRMARLYDASGQAFATMVKPGQNPKQPALAPAGPAARYTRDELEIRVPVMVENDRVGELVVVSGVDELRTWLHGYLAVAGVAFMAATAVAVVVGLWLARLLIRPISRLARAMDRVRSSGEFGHAVSRTTEDEVGDLTDAFNDLLAELKRNDLSLRQALAELTLARDRAQDASLQKSQFLANMSHEIRTPLNGVLGMAEAMQMHELSPAQAGRLEVIRASGEALLTVLNDILDISKIEAGRLEIETVEFALGPVVEAVRASFEPVAASKDLKLTADVALDAQGVWSGDPTRLRQILSNLVSNALKFTQEGGVAVEVVRTASGVRLTVTDTGIGIPADKIDQLFEKFVQADNSTTRKFGGTGLGLAICRQLAELMGGEIRVESSAAGSCFKVELPFGLVAAAPETPEAPPAKAAPPEEAERPLRILAADDNPTNRLVLQSLLEPLEVELTLVETGREAVEAWRRGPFDVILMDIQMPDLDGVEATQAIRQAEAEAGEPPIPIIALSANAMSHQIQAYLAAGMDGHLAKPIEVAKLYALLASLELRETSRAAAAA